MNVRQIKTKTIADTPAALDGAVAAWIASLGGVPGVQEIEYVETHLVALPDGSLALTIVYV